MRRINSFPICIVTFRPGTPNLSTVREYGQNMPLNVNKPRLKTDVSHLKILKSLGITVFPELTLCSRKIDLH
jgi:hypothetical protein